MIRFHRWGPDSAFYTRLPESSRLVMEEREGPYLIGRRLLYEVADWLDQHCPGWEEYDGRFNEVGVVRLELAKAEHVVEFQMRWG